MTINVTRCESCGQDHVDLEAFPLPAPIPQPSLFGDASIVYTHRVECPKTGLTLLLAL
jgi:hypothetical protein